MEEKGRAVRLLNAIKIEVKGITRAAEHCDGGK